MEILPDWEGSAGRNLDKDLWLIQAGRDYGAGRQWLEVYASCVDDPLHDSSLSGYVEGNASHRLYGAGEPKREEHGLPAKEFPTPRHDNIPGRSILMGEDEVL